MNIVRTGKFAPGRYRVKVMRGVSGLGLFALESVPRGACIVEYTGRVLSEAEEYSSRSKYLMGVRPGRTICGSSRTNLGRYVNHSCRPNAEYEVFRDRVFIMARRGIRAGEEVFCDYGRQYWKAHIGMLVCRCPKCDEVLPGDRTPRASKALSQAARAGANRRVQKKKRRARPSR